MTAPTHQRQDGRRTTPARLTFCEGFMEKEETQNHIERSSLWTDIFTIVKQLPRRNVEGDAPDAFSVSTDIEMLIAAREARLVEAYNELIFTVSHKYEGETRHQTALKYIQQAEESSGEGCVNPEALAERSEK